MFNLWLDDVRPCPPGWTHAFSVNQAIELIKEHRKDFCFASLDHDLGDYAHDGGDGYKLTRWMLESLKIDDENYFPRSGIRIHSANSTGAANMLADIDDADPYGDAEQALYGFKDWRGEPPEGYWPPALAF